MTPAEVEAVGERIVISPMRRRHLDAVLSIEEASHPVPWTRALFEGELHRGDRHYVVARAGERAERIVGHAGLIAIVDQGHVATIAVDPDERGRGHATRLLLELVEEASRRELDALTLEVRVSNDTAVRLYRRFGFAPAGVRRRYYSDGEDAIVMWLHDLDSSAVRGRHDRIRSDLGAATPRWGFPDDSDSTDGTDASDHDGGLRRHPAEAAPDHPSEADHPARKTSRPSAPSAGAGGAPGPAAGSDAPSGRMEG